jgi:hypothetical protein
MALPLGAQIGVSLLPTVAKLGANLFRDRSPSPYERQLSRYAQMFDAEASVPLTDNRMFQSGISQIDERDRRNRQAVTNRAAATGGTDESRIASMQSANQAYNSAFQRLMDSAQRYRNLMRNRHMQTLGQQEQAGHFRNMAFNEDVDRIVQPLGRTINSFLLSDIFKSPGKVNPAPEVNAPNALNLLPTTQSPFEETFDGSTYA